jgi:hypothetical protein
MAEKCFYLHDYELTVHNKSFLVLVSQLSNLSSHQNRSSDLPEWAFHSPHAIWLQKNNGSMIQRAMEGEKIKAELLHWDE